jgi:hypothetical protein
MESAGSERKANHEEHEDHEENPERSLPFVPFVPFVVQSPSSLGVLRGSIPSA